MADQDDDYRSSDDEDYVPDATEDDVEDEPSGDEAEEVTAADGEILEGRRRGKKSGFKKSSKKQKPKEESTVDVDAIFAAMLEDDAKLIPSKPDNKGESRPSTSSNAESAPATEEVKSTAPAGPMTETIITKTITEVFDFAGEEIQIRKEVTTKEYERLEEEKKKAVEKDGKKPPQKRLGIGEALTLIKKKPKMSILDKSNHDWSNFKEENQLQEELSTFNRGKSGYLGNQEFLMRADYREYENQKNLRNTRRK